MSTPNSRTGSALSPPQIGPPCLLRAGAGRDPARASSRRYTEGLYDQVLWVDLAPPYADHLMRDYGAMNLAWAVVTMVAAITIDRLIGRTTLAAYIVFAIPHLVFQPTGCRTPRSVRLPLAMLALTANTTSTAHHH